MFVSHTEPNAINVSAHGAIPEPGRGTGGERSPRAAAGTRQQPVSGILISLFLMQVIFLLTLSLICLSESHEIIFRSYFIPKAKLNIKTLFVALLKIMFRRIKHIFPQNCFKTSRHFTNNF